MLRLFVAVNLPGDLRQKIWDSTFTLRGAAPDLRWTKPDQLHATVKFLGSQPAELTANLSAALLMVAERHSHIEVLLGQFGAFPNLQRPRVVWLGITQGAEALSRVAQDVDATFATFGVPLETRPFKPHITLARSRDSLSQTQRLALAKTIKQPVNFEPFVIETLDLMRSDTAPSGSRYARLSAASLGGTQ